MLDELTESKIKTRKKIFYLIVVILIIILLFYMLKAFTGRDVPAVSEEVKETPVTEVKNDNKKETIKSDYQAGGELVYVYFSKQDEDESCNAVYPVRRAIKDIDRLYELTLRFLFTGPTSTEINNGYHSFFEPKIADSILSIKVVDSVAYLNLKDIRQTMPGASSSCGSAQLLSQIETTLLQFPEIEKIIYAIEGDPVKFYEFVQIGCNPDNSYCDKTPFETE